MQCTSNPQIIWSKDKLIKKKKKSSCIGVWLSTKISVGFSCGPIHVWVAAEASEGITYKLLHVIIFM